MPYLLMASTRFFFFFSIVDVVTQVLTEPTHSEQLADGTPVSSIRDCSFLWRQMQG